jgi:hypothetical protein
MTATLNGAPRKNLSDQIDRLDHILDGLADAIPAVVADSIRFSVRQAVQQAVQEAITEVLANQDLLRLLEGYNHVSTPKPNVPVWEPAPAPPAAPEPPPSSFVSRATKAVWNGVCTVARTVGNAIGCVGRAVWSSIKSPIRVARRCVSTIATAANVVFAACRFFAPI